MNAEALAHAIQACRISADMLTKAADAVELMLHRCPDAGPGMKRDLSEMRVRADGLRVAASCAEQMLHAMRVHPVPVPEIPRATLGDRVARLINRVRSSDARAV